MNIVEKIDDIRKERGWSVNKLATEALLTQSTVCNMFKSGSDPKISTLKAICDAFEISLSEFFYENKPAELSPKDLELLSMYNSLDDEQRTAIYNLVKSMVE